MTPYEKRCGIQMDLFNHLQQNDMLQLHIILMLRQFPLQFCKAGAAD